MKVARADRYDVGWSIVEERRKLRDRYDVGWSIVEERRKLRERIRELEAELARIRADSMKWDVIQKRKEKEQYDRAELGWERVEELSKKLGDAMTRAEKAERSEEQYRIAYEQQTENVKTLEARVAERERDDQKECAESMQQERDSVEAHVAELESQLGGLMDYIVSNGLRLPDWTKPILEAREREAD